MQNEASDLGLHCLPIIFSGVSRLKWDKLDIPGQSENIPTTDISFLALDFTGKLEMCPQYTDTPTRPLAPPRGKTLGQRYHILKALVVGKCHTKFQLSSPEGIKVISCKRNADVNLHLNLQVNLC